MHVQPTIIASIADVYRRLIGVIVYAIIACMQSLFGYVDDRHI